MSNAPYETHRAQIAAILTAWGMMPDDAGQTAEVMAWADLHGVDSHGFSMLTVYDARRREGRLRMDATPRLERETPVSALVDADGGLGHVPSRLAMGTAIAKARAIGGRCSARAQLGAFRCLRGLLCGNGGGGRP